MKKGFTLLELSIVLVIIGLIIGGITAGQGLIRSAELNSVISDVNKYKVAVNTFKLKYNALPGDMDNASSYWPTCDSTPSKCDGDKDGTINTFAPDPVDERETIRFWQHLSLSGVTQGNYTGVATTPPVLGVSHPKTSIGNSSYQIFHSSHSGKQHHYYGFSSVAATWFEPASGIVSPQEAYNMDSKIDDGHASNGAIFAQNGFLNTGCLDGAIYVGDYDLTESNNVCMVSFQF